VLAEAVCKLLIFKVTVFAMTFKKVLLWKVSFLCSSGDCPFDTASQSCVKEIFSSGSVRRKFL
jgi:hypothetical protein